MHGRTFRTLDGLRGVAALLIVTRHVSFLFDPISFQKSYLAVDLFFLMSGVVLCHSYEFKLLNTLSPWRFVWIRVVRIHPLYLLGCSLSILVILLNLDSSTHALDLPRLILLALFLLPDVLGSSTYPLNGPSWSLFFELLINFVYAFCIKFLTNRITAIITVCSAFMLVPILIFSTHHNFDLGFTIKSFPTGLFRVAYSFFAGVLLCRLFKTRPAIIAGRMGNIAAWLILIFVLGLLMLPISEKFQSYYDFFVVTLLFPFIVYGSLRLEMSGASARIFQFLGLTSYAIYVLHAPLGYLLESGLPHHRESVIVYAPWAGVAFLFGLLAVCYIVDRFYDTPIRRFLLPPPRMASGDTTRQVGVATVQAQATRRQG